MLVNLKDYKGKFTLPSLPITYLSIGSDGKPLGYMSIDYTTSKLMYNTETVVDNIKCENFGSLLYSRDFFKFIELVQGKYKNLGYFTNPEQASIVYQQARTEQADKVKSYLRSLNYLPEEVIQLIK